ncbi:MAG: hypothetical protein GX660_04285 [Clostridiaceae bacterium]|nr:hypothetical protein [Clostridiaceae bacterium]
MGDLVDLQILLENLICSRNVYFQPPASLNISYPAIVYSLDDIPSKYADDGVYFSRKKYLLTVIDEDPDNDIIEKIKNLPTCRFSRHFKSDNLNHYVFTITY